MRREFPRTLSTAGDGYWTDMMAPVRVTHLELAYINDEGDFGELRVYFDTLRWNVDVDGLIYTDTKFLKQLRAELNKVGYAGKDVEYSEQGMQGDDYVSFDVGEDFINSFNSIVAA